MDNASANTTLMQELEKMLKERNVDFDATDCQIMCYAHVINLSSGRVIQAASHAAAVNNDDNDYNDSWSEPSRPVPHMQDQQSYADAVARDPIALGWTAVWVIRASGTRREAFYAVIDTGNKEK